MQASLPFCAEAAPGEPLIGTAAASTDAWVLWEQFGAWAPEPLASDGMADDVRAHLTAFLRGSPRSRLQLIRRRDRPPGGPRRLFVGGSGDGGGDGDGRHPWLVAFDLEAPAQLVEIDLGAVLAEGGHPAASPVEVPVHLVCTHGKRDQCCARWGIPLYQAMAAVDPEHVWFTTHTGGHRFAPNVVSFPHGVTYGRVAVGEAKALVEGHAAGRMHDLARLRGRTCYDAPTQAAELFVRSELGCMGLDDLRHLGTSNEGDRRWRVRFAHGDEAWEVTVASEVVEGTRPKSCGDAPSPIERFVPLRKVALMATDTSMR
jgi:hypothetical protein